MYFLLGEVHRKSVKRACFKGGIGPQEKYWVAVAVAVMGLDLKRDKKHRLRKYTKKSSMEEGSRKRTFTHTGYHLISEKAEKIRREII